MNLHVLAKTYGQLPSQVLKSCDLVDWNLNLHVLIAGQEAEEAAAKRSARKRER